MNKGMSEFVNKDFLDYFPCPYKGKVLCSECSEDCNESFNRKNRYQSFKKGYLRFLSNLWGK